VDHQLIHVGPTFALKFAPEQPKPNAATPTPTPTPARHERSALGDGPVSCKQANSSITPRRGFIRDNSVLGRK
jgi:hypothetical protein